MLSLYFAFMSLHRQFVINFLKSETYVIVWTGFVPFFNVLNIFISHLQSSAAKLLILSTMLSTVKTSSQEDTGVRSSKSFSSEAEFVQLRETSPFCVVDKLLCVMNVYPYKVINKGKFLK